MAGSRRSERAGLTPLCGRSTVFSSTALATVMGSLAAPEATLVIHVRNGERQDWCCQPSLFVGQEPH